jgi:hypothetical protein
MIAQLNSKSENTSTINLVQYAVAIQAMLSADAM